jgi:hypothetical protein
LAAAAAGKFLDPLEMAIPKKEGQTTRIERERLKEWIHKRVLSVPWWPCANKLGGAMNCRKFAEFAERTRVSTKF